MKKFKFRLQTILDLRLKELENSQLEFALAQNKYEKALNLLEFMYQLIDKTKKDLETVLASNIDFTLINNYQNYIHKIEEAIKNQHKIIADLELNVEEKRNLMFDALKAKKMIEKLKEKDLREFNTNIEKLDLIEIDEIATNRYKKAN